MTDSTRMTDGIHKGIRMLSVPAAYLLNLPKDVVNPELKKCVHDNLAVLKLEVRRDRGQQYKQWLRKSRAW